METLDTLPIHQVRITETLDTLHHTPRVRTMETQGTLHHTPQIRITEAVDILPIHRIITATRGSCSFLSFVDVEVNL
jgi:hypothetical protein